MPRFTYIAFVLTLAALLTACGQAAPSANTQVTSGPAAASQGGVVEPVLAFSEAVAGRNRIALGLVQNGTPINDPAAKVRMRFFNLDENNPQPQGETDATYFGQGLPVGYYVAYATLDKPGTWGIEVESQLPGQTEPSKKRLRLPVLEKSSVPNVGDSAIATKTLTAADVPDLKQLSSGPNPDPAMYRISLDEALTNGKPTVLLFATPAFCRTATCAPSLDVVQGLQKTHGEKLNFIHVEVFNYPFSDSALQLNKLIAEQRPLTSEELSSVFAEPMRAWGLTTEPWLYLIDAQGTIVGRYEGGITQEELGPALEKLVAGEPVT